MRRAHLKAGLAAMAAAAIVAAPAMAQNTFKSGNWNGGPFFNGQQFSHCYVNVGYADGTQLMIQLTPQMVMYVGASKSSWNMDPTQQYDVSFEVDGGYKKSFRGRVTADRRNAIWFTIGNDADLRRRIEQLEARLDAICDWIDNQGTPKETP